MRIFRNILLALALAAPSLALAAPGSSAPAISTASAGMKVKRAKRAGRSVPAFDKADTNGDHRIEWMEAKAVGVPRGIFHRYDYQHDGKLTSTEWKLVNVAMVHTVDLPRPESASLPAVPASVARSVHAAGSGTISAAVTKTVAGPVTAPPPATGGRRGRK